MIDPKLVDLLACPACHGDVAVSGEKIVCKACGRKYPIKNGVPVLIVSESEK